MRAGAPAPPRARFTMKFRANITLLLLVMCASRLSSQTISVTGAWDLTLSASNLVSGAGSNLADTYTSATDAAYIDISVFPYVWNWQVSVNMTVTSWNSNLQLWARRTGNGSSWFGTISGGTAYQQVTTAAQPFFAGFLNRSSVPIQYQIRNVSALIPAATYTVSIVYTLEER